MKPDAYQPIACALHSEFELAIMRHSVISISWFGDDAVKHVERVLPLDIRVNNGEEFLVFMPQGNAQSEQRESTARLDRVTLLKS
jgi:transcriptional antiterminator Rof (Rho-off)